LGLRQGSRVKVSSTNGYVETKVKVTEHIRQGVVFIPFHFAEVAVNKLIGNQHDPVVLIPEFKVCAVRLEGVK
jgi:anaerobic selenocysteine-containing dehydrogenase